MRWTVVNHYTGLFLKIFSVLLLVPVAVGKYYGESFVGLEPFLLASFLAIVLGWMLAKVGTEARPEAIEAMTTATVAWLLAVGIGAIPLMTMADIPFIDAYFETMSGFTTTGMSILLSKDLPRSILFWRSFTNWIGGLGILTFFVTVLVESGGVATKFVSTEANKTASGAIRPSLFNAIKSLWYVYLVLTVLQALALYYFGMTPFNAVNFAMATVPTGGFAPVMDMNPLMNPQIRATFTLFMFLGGTNFLLIYSLFRGNLRRMVDDFEFRIYAGLTAAGVAIIAADLALSRGTSTVAAASNSLFHTVSAVSSAGFTLEPVGEFPELSRFVFLVLMFVGGSLGSTTGGIKMLRLGVLAKLAVQQIKSIGLPPTVLNPVSIGRRIIDDEEILQIAAIVFLWLAAIVVGGMVTVAFSPYGIVESMQLMISGVGTMGPTFIPQAELAALHPAVKVSVMVGMLAGRLEMLPLLSLLNIRLVRKFT